MSTEVKLTQNQIQWLKLLVKGYGFDASKKQFSGKSRKEMEQLIEMGYVKLGKNFTGDKVGMFCIVDDKKAEVKELINAPKTLGI